MFDSDPHMDQLNHHHNNTTKLIIYYVRAITFRWLTPCFGLKQHTRMRPFSYSKLLLLLWRRRMGKGKWSPQFIQYHTTDFLMWIALDWTRSCDYFFYSYLCCFRLFSPWQMNMFPTMSIRKHWWNGSTLLIENTIVSFHSLFTYSSR